jgi:hypothetical protein
MRDGVTICGRVSGYWCGTLAPDPGSWALCATCRKMREREAARPAPAKEQK